MEVSSNKGTLPHQPRQLIWKKEKKGESVLKAGNGFVWNLELVSSHILRNFGVPLPSKVHLCRPGTAKYLIHTNHSLSWINEPQSVLGEAISIINGAPSQGCDALGSRVGITWQQSEALP